MAASIYLEGRTRKNLNENLNSSELKDCVFISDRIDTKCLSNSSFEHCTFANISFKGAKIIKDKFTNCVFIGCYFRKCDVTESTFIGCKFIDSTFPGVIIKCCIFEYTFFSNCFIPYNELEYSLPGAPNLREDLARNLSVESAKLGYFDESNRYRREELKAREKHLWAAFKGETQWYRDHYDCCRQLKALFEYIISVLNGFFFGYGQYFYPLLRNLFFSIIFFWGLFFVFKDQLINTETSQSPNGLDTLLYSLHNILPTGIEVKVQAIHGITRVLAGFEALWGIILAAYVASYIFRWSLNK